VNGEARDELSMHLLLINRRPSNTIPTLIVKKEKVIFYARDRRERPSAARNNYIMK
jgi:hypothetical protein